MSSSFTFDLKQKNCSAVFSEAVPKKGRAFLLRERYNDSLLSSCKYLLEACEEVLSVADYRKAREKLESYSIEDKLSGLLSAAHADLCDAIEEDNIDRVNEICIKLGENDANFIDTVNEICIKLGENDFRTSGINYVNYSDLGEYYTPLLENTFHQDHVAGMVFSPLTTSRFQNVEESVSRGLNLLRRLLPDFYDEFSTLLGEILIFNVTKLKSGSSANTFGMIFLNHQYKWQKLTDVLDLLTHECSHLYVHGLNIFDELLYNPDESHFSPIRTEERPLMGIYHAAFVLARICHVLEKCLKSGEIPEEEQEYCENQLSTYKSYYEESFEVLQKHAQMTPLATDLLESSMDLVGLQKPLAA